MDRYEQLSVVGEGSYGLVMKCKHKETEQVVAVKKFLETEEDATVRKMALREIRMLKRLKHENLVTMIEVFRYRKRFYLVFEFVEGTVLDELEKCSGGLDEETCRERIFQVTRAVHFCHMNNVIHRDIKPENVLVSSLGVVKLCDFGFARLVSIAGEQCTEYVATRWYRAPELLVGEPTYGAPVDIWAIGCLFAEMMTGDPLFPGDSDIDQLYLTIRLLGKPCTKHQMLMTKNAQLRGMVRSAASDSNGLYKAFSNWHHLTVDFLACCVKMDPQSRPTADELLRHSFFTHDRFPHKYLPALREKVIAEFNENPLLRRIKSDVLLSTDRADRKEETRPRRSSQIEPLRWRINLAESSIKRKFSCDTLKSCDSISGSDKNTLLSKSGQKLSGSSQVSVPKQSSLQSMIKEKVSKEILNTPKLSQSTFERTNTSANRSEIQMLQKTLESLSKLSQKTEGNRPASAQKEEKTGSPLTLNPPSPPQFQSLQPAFSDFNKSPSVSSQHSQNILHPSINNICFNKDPPKKSPNILQSIQNCSIKGTFNQVPLLNPPKGQQYLKRLERNVCLDNMLMNAESAGQNNINSGPTWLNTVGKKKEKARNDEFSLPNVPGATSSPNKSKKKSQMSPEALTSQAITPRIKSTASQKSTTSNIFTQFLI